ncbi:MAG: Protein of unknown function rane [Frankiales bacterium]|nr:Protein of unknown function rane [Frankiales bacterium]
MTGRWRARRPHGDGGTVMLLVLGFCVVLVGLVAVVVDVSVVLLNQRGVASAADGAAVAAAQRIDERAFYEDGLGQKVPLDPGEVQSTVATYEGAVQPATQLVARVEGGFTVVVEGSRAVSLPFSRFLTGSTVTVRSTARATSPVVG